MIPPARVRHCVAGRTRIAVESMRNDLHYYVRVVQTLGGLPEVYEVTANPRSAALLVIHEEGALPVIVDKAREARLFDLAPLELEGHTGIARAGAGMAAVDRLLRKNSGQDVDVSSLLNLLLIPLALVQISRGQIMVPAMSLLWFATELLNRNKPGNVQKKAERVPGHGWPSN